VRTLSTPPLENPGESDRIQPRGDAREKRLQQYRARYHRLKAELGPEEMSRRKSVAYHRLKARVGPEEYNRRKRKAKQRRRAAKEKTPRRLGNERAGEDGDGDGDGSADDDDEGPPGAHERPAKGGGDTV